MTKPTVLPEAIQIHCDGHNLLLSINGVKIAKRGLPGTAHAKAQSR
jgi:hypothetical protein